MVIDKSVLANEVFARVRLLRIAIEEARVAGLSVNVQTSRDAAGNRYPCVTSIYEPSPEPVSTEHVPDWDKAPHINEE